MRFFLPEFREDEWEDRYQGMRSAHSLVSDRRVYRVRYQHDGNEIEATVGRQRTTQRNKRIRAGHYELTGRPRPSGNVIVAILEANPYYIYEMPGPSAWANPSLAGQQAILEVEYFESEK